MPFLGWTVFKNNALESGIDGAGTGLLAIYFLEFSYAPQRYFVLPRY